MAELLLGALLPVLFERLVSREMINFAKREKVGDLVKKWETKLRYISALLEDAEEKAMSGDVKVQPWLEDLQDLAYDIDNIVDEFVTEEGIRSLAKQAADGARTSKVRSLVTSLRPGFMSDHKLRSRMKKIDLRLNFILEQKRDLGLNESSGSTRKTSPSNSHRMTDSLPPYNVIGRQKDESAILAELLKEQSDDQHLSVIPIVGLGGVGKTTLAQSVFNNPAVVKAFPKRGWACISDNFNMIEIARALLGSLGGSVGTNDDLNVLHNKLREILSKEKFLIVLDDYWNVDYNNWERLYNLYSLGVEGSKVIVTTRNQDVASMMTNRHTVSLGELSRDDCLSLLAYHALGVENFDAHSHLKLMGEEIAAKCKGLPLAAKTLGGLLRSKSDTKEWENIRGNKIWNLPQGEDGILLALKLSYVHLPTHLKRCFVFCAIFPEDYEFDRDELVLLWMAEGLVVMNRENAMSHMMYQGRKQFDELLNLSFFQQSTQNKSMFVMHDLMHDLAKSIGGNTCLNVKTNEIEDIKHKSPEKVRHLLYSSTYGDRLVPSWEKLHVLKGLRTFISNHRQMFGHLPDKAQEELLQNLKYLRALCLSYNTTEKLPNCIGHLKHLRYLNFSRSTNLKELPDSICTLYNLETLILKSCFELTELPPGMDKLINLKCLDIGSTLKLKKMPVELGHMHNLEILTKFIVGEEEDGLRLKLLRNLQHLQGDICIQDLQNVEDVGDSRDAWLSRKVGLTTIALIWKYGSSFSRNANKEQQVIEFLEPHREIKGVNIEFYGGISFPSWIGSSSFINMTTVRLRCCKKVTILPSCGILPCLRELLIEGMDAVRAVGSEFYGNVKTPFPSLEVLKFKDMPAWEVWSSSSSSGGVKEIEEPFPRLIKLQLENCTKLVSYLPSRLSSVVEIKIYMCPLLKASPCIADLSSLEDLNLDRSNDLSAMMISSRSQNAPIKRVSLRSIKELTYLNQDTFCVAERLEIENCNELLGLREKNVISEAVVGNLADCLKYLCIKDCPYLEVDVFPKLPSCLRSLTLWNCKKIKALPNQMNTTLTSLQRLVLIGLSIESFPEGGLPLSIEELRIADCPELKQPLEEWGFSILTALKTLAIKGEIGIIIGTSSFPPHPSDWMFFPSNLEVLEIYAHPYLVRLLNGLQDHLISLRRLELHDCPNLRFLPEEGFPPSLERLRIIECSQDIESKCSKNGDYFPLIRSIPDFRLSW